METLILRAGRAVVGSLLKAWIADRRDRRERELPLSELINVRLQDDFQRRLFRRELEAMTDAVAQRLLSVCSQGLRGLDEGECKAAIAAVADTFETADLSDSTLFIADANPEKLARHLRTHLSGAAPTRRSG